MVEEGAPAPVSQPRVRIVGFGMGPQHLTPEASEALRASAYVIAARKSADDTKAAMVAGKFDIFKGGSAGLKDNTGKVVIAAGKAYKQTDVELEGMNYLVEGVVGKV